MSEKNEKKNFECNFSLFIFFFAIFKLVKYLINFIEREKKMYKSLVYHTQLSILISIVILLHVLYIIILETMKSHICKSIIS